MHALPQLTHVGPVEENTEPTHAIIEKKLTASSASPTPKPVGIMTAQNSAGSVPNTMKITLRTAFLTSP